MKKDRLLELAGVQLNENTTSYAENMFSEVEDALREGRKITLTAREINKDDKRYDEFRDIGLVVIYSMSTE